MNDLYLIGNGFDLAHGLKTSYNDFLLWYLKSSVSKILPNDHYEDNLIKIDRRFNNPIQEHSLISDLLDECKKYQIIIDYKHPFFQNIVEKYRDYRWVDVEYEYYMALVNLYKRLERAGISKNEGIEKELERLNVCFGSIKRKLIEYLTIVDKSSKQENEKIKNVLFEGTGVDCMAHGEKLFLYFNYTSTLDLYTDHYFAYEYNSIFIHGKLEELLDYIIFGYGDEMDPHYEKIEHLNTNEFLKNIKSFGYFKTSNYQKLIRFIGSMDFTVKILGHSCGLSDRILLNTIFEHENCKSIKIFYHQKSETENDYFEKTQEISRHFKASGKESMRTKIVSFDESVPLIPFDDI